MPFSFLNKNWKYIFFTIYVGQAVSILTSSILQFGIIWYITETTGSSAILALGTLLGFLPQALIGPFAGVFVDRYDRKKIMIISDLFVAAASLLLVFCSRSAGFPIWLIMLVLFCRALGSAFHTPSLQAVTPILVPENMLTKCNGYAQAIQSISMILSPVLAAVLYSKWDLFSMIILDVVGALFAVLTLVFIKIPKLPPKKQQTGISVLHDMQIGFKAIKDRPGLFSLIMICAVYVMPYISVSSLFPIMCMSYLGGDTSDASIVEVSYSLGFLLGSLLLGICDRYKNQIPLITAGGIISAAAILVTGLVDQNGLFIFIICSGIMGFGSPFFFGLINVVLQRVIAPQYLGRTFATFSSIRALAMPVGLACGGFISNIIGVNNWFLLSGIFGIITALCCLIIPSVRKCA